MFWNLFTLDSRVEYSKKKKKEQTQTTPRKMCWKVDRNEWSFDKRNQAAWASDSSVLEN